MNNKTVLYYCIATMGLKIGSVLWYHHEMVFLQDNMRIMFSMNMSFCKISSSEESIIRLLQQAEIGKPSCCPLVYGSTDECLFLIFKILT
jgi:hypothetical protein